MKRIIATLLILITTVGVFALTEEEKRIALFDLAIKYAKQVNTGYTSESTLKVLYPLDQIKITSMEPSWDSTSWYQVRTDWQVIDTIKGEQIELLLVSYKGAVFYIAVSDELGVILNPDKYYLDYKEKCRLVYLDDDGIYYDENGKTRKACRFMFAKGWGEEATIN